VPGGPGGDVDEVAANGSTPDFGVGEVGQGPGGAQQVIGDGGQGKPGGVGRERADGKWARSRRSASTCSTWAWSRCYSSA
jgi:hypothetical protein